jgi:integrase
VAALAEHRQAQQAHYDKLGFTPSHGLVFDSLAGTPFLPRNLDKTYSALQAKAKVPHAKFHDMRHWHASMLIEEGWDIRLIAKRLGHADPSITLRIYAHLINKQRQEEAISLDAILPKVEESTPTYLN